MSVVNKMLKDLERRELNSAVSADYIPSQKQTPKSSIIIGLLLCLVCLFAVLIWLITKDTHFVPLESDAHQLTLSENKPINTPAEKPAVLKDAELDTSSTKTIVQEAKVSLDEKALSKNRQPSIQDHSETLSLAASAAEPKKEVSFQKENADTPLNSKGRDKHGASQVTPIRAAKHDISEPQKQNSSMQVSVSAQVSSNPDIEAQANKALQAGDKSEAILLFKRVLSQNPYAHDARKKLASLLFAHQQREDAARVLQAGLSLNEKDSAMRLMQARLLFKSEQTIEALHLLMAHPTQANSSDELLSFRAALAEQQGEYSQATLDYTRLLVRQPNNDRWWLGLGVSLDKQGKHADAIDAYQRVVGSSQMSSQVLAFVKTRVDLLEAQ